MAKSRALSRHSFSQSCTLSQSRRCRRTPPDRQPTRSSASAMCSAANVRLSCHVHSVGEQRTYVTACSVERYTRICRRVLTPLRGGRAGGRRPVRRRSLGVQCSWFVLQKLSKELEGKDNGLQMTLAPSMVETAGFAKCSLFSSKSLRSRDIVLYCEGREESATIVDHVCAHVRIRRGGPLFVFYLAMSFHFHAVASNRGEFAGRGACNTSV